MLTGVISCDRKTSEAYIYGYDIQTQMKEIRKLIGVIPQYDVSLIKLSMK